MIEVYKTTRPEIAARWLSKTFPKVLVRSYYLLDPPVRFRKAMLPIGTTVARGNEADVALKRWEERGGIIVSYRNYVDVRHDAQVVAECPLSMRWLETTARAAKFVVVRKPLDWSGHWRALDRVATRPETARLAWNALCGASRSSPLFGIFGGDTIMLDDDLVAACDALSIKQLRADLFKRSPLGFFTVLPIIPRIAPDESAYKPLYELILESPSVAGTHYLKRNTIYDRAPRWKGIMRKLERTGCIHIGKRIGIYRLDVASPPRFDLIEKRRLRAERRLREIIQEIEDAPRLSLQRIRWLAGRFLSSSSAPSESSEHSRHNPA